MSEDKIVETSDFLSRIIRERRTGLSKENAFIFLSLIEVYFENEKKNTKIDLIVFDLIPVLFYDKEENQISTSLGCALRYLTGTYKNPAETEIYGKYNPDMFFSVVGLHWMIAEIAEDSRALFPEVHRKAEQVFRLLISVQKSMQGLKICLANIQQSSLAHIDIFCPLLSAITKATDSSVSETRLAYATIFKSGLRPIFHIQK